MSLPSGDESDGLSVAARREIRRALTEGRAVSDPALLPAAIRRGEEALRWVDTTRRRQDAAGIPGRWPWLMVVAGLAVLAFGAYRGLAGLLVVGGLATLLGAAVTTGQPLLRRRFASLRRRVEASLAANRQAGGQS
jgi:hypothetical protein